MNFEKQTSCAGPCGWCSWWHWGPRAPSLPPGAPPAGPQPGPPENMSARVGRGAGALPGRRRGQLPPRRGHRRNSWGGEVWSLEVNIGRQGFPSVVKVQWGSGGFQVYISLEISRQKKVKTFQRVGLDGQKPFRTKHFVNRVFMLSKKVRQWKFHVEEVRKSTFFNK